MEEAVNDITPLLSGRTLRHHFWGGLFLFVVVVSIGYLLFSTVSWMLDEQRLPLSKFVIQGDLKHTDSGQVQVALSHIDPMGTFMSQNVDELQRSILTLPWVAQASIRKQWPDLIKIYIVEHKASAIWNGIDLLNESGDVFHADVGQLTEDKVRLYGPKNSSREVLEKWREANPLFSSLGLSISSLVLNERRAWQIILDDGIRLELGKTSTMERIQRFLTLYQKLGEKAKEVSYIDLRYDTGAAVGWIAKQESEQENIDG